MKDVASNFFSFKGAFKGAMRHWLVKTEPDVYPIDDLKRDKRTQWTDVRNYEARNYLTAMEVGDEVLIYHSNADPTGIVGLGKVVKKAYPDPGQFNSKGEYFDEKASKESPRWFAPDIGFKEKFSRTVSIGELKKEKSLSSMALFKRSRLSVQPVTQAEFQKILQLVKN